ncbi:MAG: hypothetical protein FJX47_14240, partial [Alphaproteobacteria bacterium]|nr:hypothetical protein [Alphaproteobacteria bacterium]
DLKREADSLATEAERLRERAIQAAAAVQSLEDEIAEFESRLEHLAGHERDLLAALDNRRRQMVSTLGALERLSRRPPEALALAPGHPADAIRSARLLAEVAPALKADSDALGRELGELAELRREIETEKRHLADASAALKAQRQSLAALAERKVRELRKTLSDDKATEARLDRLAGEASDLRGLISRIEETRARQDREAEARHARKTVAMAVPAANLPLPARGQIVLAYGQVNEVGQTSRGLAIRTRREAQVVAPFDGEVVFAGPFRGHGLLLIMAHPDGYHSLLSGFGRVDAIVGQSVLSGEPVGIMGAEDGGPPRLYVELRRNGEPVNPLPWLTASRRKVSG